MQLVFAFLDQHEHEPLQIIVRTANQEIVVGDPVLAAATDGHSPDFRSVVDSGKTYSFTSLQAAVVKLLWEAKEDGGADLGQAMILETVGSESDRLRNLFHSGNGQHPAWGTLIMPGVSKGSYRLR